MSPKLYFLLLAISLCLLQLNNAELNKNADLVKDEDLLDEIEYVEKTIAKLSDNDLDKIFKQVRQHSSIESSPRYQYGDKLHKRGFLSSLLEFGSAFKKKYSSVSFTPKTLVDFVRLGTMAAELINSPLILEDSTFGVFTGTAMCMNCFCSPISLINHILFVLTYVEAYFNKAKESVEIMNDIVLKRTTSLPAIGPAAKATSTFLDSAVEPVFDGISATTKKFKEPILAAYNFTYDVGNKCLDVKTFMILANIIAIMQDTSDPDTNFREDLNVVNEEMKKGCGTALQYLPTWGNIIYGFYLAGVAIAEDSNPVEVIDESTVNDTSNEGSSGKKRSKALKDLKGYNTAHFFTNVDPVTLALEEVKKAMETVEGGLSVFKPIIDFFDSIKRIINTILNFEVCIPINPFGALLDAVLDIDIGGAIADAAKFFRGGNFVGVASLFSNTLNFGSLGKLEGIIDNLDEQILDIGEGFVDGLTNIYSDVKGAVDYVKNNGEKAIKTVGNEFKKAGSTLKKLFGKRKKRELLLQTPNMDYYIKRNITANLAKRGSGGITADMVAQLSGFIKNGKICITMQKILDLVSLLETILKPFQDLVSAILSPILDEFEKMFSGIFPSFDFLDKLKDISINVPSLDEFTNMLDISSLMPDLYTKINDQIEKLNPDCIAYAREAAGHKPTRTIQEVHCKCISGLSGCSKRNVEEKEVEKKAVTGSECKYAGVDYQGTKSTTKGGKTCMHWDVQDPHSHTQKGENMPEMSLGMAENYCRIPNTNPEPWCYTIAKSKRWDYCGILLCTACISSGRETTGKVTYTGSGFKCQAWKTQNPHTHSHTDSQVPESTLSRAENFCHNPGNKATGPWCYTTDQGRIWDVCDVPKCDSFSRLLNGYKAYSYAECAGNNIWSSGHKSKTFEGCVHACEGESNCKGFVYQGNNDRCYIKSKCDYSSYTFKSAMVTYIKSQAPNYQAISNKDCNGNTLQSTRTINIKECAELCNRDRKCTGFLWKGNGRYCYLKEFCDASSLSNKNSHVLYIKDEMPLYKRAFKLDCGGNDLYRKTVSSVEECARICSKEPLCITFQYDSNNGNCWPKTKCDTTSYKSNGDLNHKQVGLVGKYSDRDCPGWGLKSYNDVYTAQICADKCRRSHENCVAFTYLVKTGKCYIKKNCPISALVMKEDHDTYIIDQAPEYDRYMNKQCLSNNIGSTVYVINQQSCAKLCNDDIFCVGFIARIFQNDEVQCILKHTCDVVSLQTKAFDTFIKKRVMFFDKKTFRDCSGNDMTKKTTDTLEDCAEMCYENAMCVAFQYHKKTSTTGNCWVKTKCGGLTTQTVGRLHIQKQILNYERSMLKDCHGNDIVQYQDQSVEYCADKCSAEQTCMSFGYKESGGRKCWLKKKCIPTSLKSHSTIHMHVNVDIPGFKFYKNEKCNGNDISSKNVDSISQCAALCYIDVKCVAFGLDNGYKCTLKHKCDADTFTNSNGYKIYIIQVERAHTIEAAHGKSTYQSSTYNDKKDCKSGESKKAVDGNTNKDYGACGCTHTKETDKPWWGVYFGSSKTLVHIVIYNRANGHGKRLQNFNIYVSNTKPSGSLSASKTKCKYVARELSDGEVLTVTCDAPVTGKYMMIQLDKKEYLTLCEVKAFVLAT